MRKKIFIGLSLLALLATGIIFSDSFFSNPSKLYADDCSAPICLNCHTQAHSCTSCHGNPPTFGAHLKHASPSEYGYSCDECHYNGMTTGFDIDYKTQIGFKGGHEKRYDGSSTKRYDGTNNTLISNNNTFTCSNVYCHSDGTSVATSLKPVQTSPSFFTTNTPLACDGCHGYPPSYKHHTVDIPKANLHYKTMSDGSVKPHQHGDMFTCDVCHYTVTQDGRTISNPQNHANGIYDVAPNPNKFFVSSPIDFRYVYDRFGGWCMNVSCHPNFDTGLPPPHLINKITRPAASWSGYPNALASSSSDVSECTEIALNLSGNVYGPPYVYIIDFGDGSPITEIISDKNPVRVIHRYPVSGATYNYKFAMASTTSQKLTPTVSRFASTPQLPYRVPPSVGGSVSISGRTVTLTDTSWDRDFDMCGNSGPGTIEIRWSSSSSWVRYPINLTNKPSNQTFSHTYPVPGSYTISHRVLDNKGNSSSTRSYSVTVQ